MWWNLIFEEDPDLEIVRQLQLVKDVCKIISHTSGLAFQFSSIDGDTSFLHGLTAGSTPDRFLWCGERAGEYRSQHVNGP